MARRMFVVEGRRDRTRRTGQNNPETAANRRPAQGSQKSFLHMQNYTFAKFSSNLQYQLILQGIRMKLENHFYTTGKNKNSPEKNSRKHFHRIFSNFSEVSGKSHSAENPSESSMLAKQFVFRF